MSDLNPYSEIKNLKELSHYLDRIQVIETSRIRSENVLLSNIWGILMVFAGLVDLNVVVYSGYSPHFFVWFFAVAVGFIIQKLITSQPMIYDELVPKSHPRQVVRWYHMLVMFIMFLGTLVVSEIEYSLILPYVFIVLGVLEGGFTVVDVENPTERYKIRLRRFLPSLIGALFLFSLGFINPELNKLQGLLFGIIIGSSSLYAAQKEKRKIEAERLEAEIEIRENMDEN